MVSTATILDSLAQVLAEVVGGYIFSAGTTTDVTTAEPTVVPLADDFSEAGMPAVTVALGPWKPLLQPGNERLHLIAKCAVWRERVPLADNVQALYADRDAIADALIAHGKLFLHEPAVASAVLQGGQGIVARAVPRGLSAAEPRIFLTLPFTVEIVCNRAVVPQPA